MAWKQILSLAGLLGLCAGRKISSCFCEQTERIHRILHTLGNALFQILIVGAVLYLLYRGIKQCITWLTHYITRRTPAETGSIKTLRYLLGSSVDADLPPCGCAASFALNKAPSERSNLPNDVC